jgi:NitT/TauT family transport system substrate-binding protein
MKKALSLLLIAMLAFSLLAVCAGKKTEVEANAGKETAAPAEQTQAPSQEPTIEETAKPAEPETAFRIGGLTGATSIGMVKLMEDAANGASKNKYEFTITGSADELTPKLIQGELDIAAIPANLVSVLYNNTEGKIKMLAVNTLGVLYIVTKGADIGSVADLKGKTIYATAKGSVPEYVLRYILSSNGIDPDKDVVIEFKSEPSEVVALMASGEASVAMLPQPYVTVAAGQVEGLAVALDMTEEWNKLGNGSTLITGALAVRSEFAAQYPEQLAAFLEEYKASTEYVNANVEEAARLVEKYGIFKAAVAAKAIPYCNITYIAGEDMKAPVSGYLKVLFDQNPKAVGGSLPGEDFYYAP